MPKKQKDTSRKTHSHIVTDLPLRDGNAANVTGGRDPATGLPTGKRMHKPITLTVESEPIVTK